MPRVRVSITSAGGPGQILRISREGFREAYETAGRTWFQGTLPRHFTVEGAREYGYQQRTARYMKRKARQKGHQRPLVFTGEMERQVKRTERVEANDKGASVKLYGPRYLFAYRKDLGAGDKARELTAVTVAEEAALGRLVSAVALRRFEQERSRRIRIR